MTQKDKELLLKDLCTRLPYGVIVRHADPLIDNDGNENGEFWYKRGYLCDITTLDDMTTTIIESKGSDAEGYEHICFLERTVPYLRPMPSMTEEEKIELYQIAGFYYLSNNELLKDEWRQFSDALSENKLFLPYPIWEDNLNKVYNWLNKQHFDYRGLIEKGLAIEAPDGMYN